MGTRKEWTGNAVAAHFTAQMTVGAMTCTIDNATGWPVGSFPFVAIANKGTVKEQKILFSGRSGTTLTVSASPAGRAWDGTTAAQHEIGDALDHAIDADTMSDFSRHIYDTASDDHTQYLNIARHDVTARHTFGAALGTPGTPAAVDTAGSAGSAGSPPRSDHVHALSANVAGAGLILSAGALAVNVDNSSLEVNADIVRVKALGITGAMLATAIAGAGLTQDGSGNLQLSPDNSTVELSGDTLRVKDAGITLAKIAADVETEVISFSFPGTLAVVNPSKLRWRAPRAYTIKHVRLNIDTAPTGAAILVDVDKRPNGSDVATTIYTTQGNRPTIAISAKEESAITAPDVTALAAGDKLSVNIDQIGSTIAGADLVVNIYLQRA